MPRMKKHYSGEKTLKQQVGQQAENLAEAFLREQGLVFQDKNFNCKLGEIDLIFSDNDQLVFVEVRFRRNSARGSAAESITRRKQACIAKAAVCWLSSKQLGSKAMRFDAVLFDEEIDRDHLTWLRAIF